MASPVLMLGKYPVTVGHTGAIFSVTQKLPFLPLQLYLMPLVPALPGKKSSSRRENNEADRQHDQSSYDSEDNIMKPPLPQSRVPVILPFAFIVPSFSFMIIPS